MRIGEEREGGEGRGVERKGEEDETGERTGEEEERVGEMKSKVRGEAKEWACL